MTPAHDSTTVDIVVVGFGAAGAAAALTAAEHGASVVIIEKLPRDGHTPSTMMSGGLIMSITDIEAATHYLDACAAGMVPSEVSRAWARKASELDGWLLRQAGLATSVIGGAEHLEFSGADAIAVRQLASPDAQAAEPSADALAVRAAGTFKRPVVGAAGFKLFAGLACAVDERGIEVRWGCPAVRLERSQGRVVGVHVAVGDLTELIRGERGVVLACGGYGNDEQLKRHHLKAFPVYFYGNPGNVGDGVRMAQAVGADLWHMNQMVGRGIGHFPRKDRPPLTVALRLHPPGYVIVDRHGRRFANETAQAEMKHAFYYEMIGFDSERLEYPRIPSYWIFDEHRRSAGPLTSTLTGPVRVGLGQWSADNRAEIDCGWIASSDTVEGATAAAGVEDPTQAAATVDLYNAACRSGTDAFGRPAHTLVPLDQPPYYCVPLYPGGSNTSGGPRRDQYARVLDPFGEPIPGLYGAGELGQAIGFLYPADGANISEAICFGQIAVDAALNGAVAT